MKKSILLQLILIAYSAISIAQSTDCNKAVQFNYFTKLIPKEVCIPNGNYHITDVSKRLDINGDGLEDFIFDWNKNPLQDGDSLYITIYTQNQDSTFSPFRTFSNLYPFFFKSYNRDYVPKNKKLREIHKKYESKNPLIKLTFKKEIIVITRRGDATDDLIITYRYDKNIKNWRYVNTMMHNRFKETDEPYDLSQKLGPLIDNFTYFIWDED